ncbi:hypothetical protein Bca101_076192 [Brassica carinata]
MQPCCGVLSGAKTLAHDVERIGGEKGDEAAETGRKGNLKRGPLDADELNLQETGLEPSGRQMKVDISFWVKALHHEVTCKNALLKAKCSEQEGFGLECVQYAIFDGPTYEWVVISRQPNLIGKTLWQFTPVRWDKDEWHPLQAAWHVIQVLTLCIIFLTVALNTLFLKFSMWIPSTNPLILYSLILWLLIARDEALESDYVLLQQQA